MHHYVHDCSKNVFILNLKVIHIPFNPVIFAIEWAEHFKETILVLKQRFSMQLDVLLLKHFICCIFNLFSLTKQ